MSTCGAERKAPRVRLQPPLIFMRAPGAARRSRRDFCRPVARDGRHPVPGSTVLVAWLCPTNAGAVSNAWHPILLVAKVGANITCHDTERRFRMSTRKHERTWCANTSQARCLPCPKKGAWRCGTATSSYDTTGRIQEVAQTERREQSDPFMRLHVTRSSPRGTPCQR